MDMTSKTIIIGAGAAGLAAGRLLHDNGVEVTILEARDRIGGRVWTSYNLAPHPIELGAEFIHGSSVITWDYLKQYGLDTLPPIEDRNVYAKLNGKIKRYEKLIKRDWEEDIWDASEAWFEDGNPDISLRTLMDKKGWLKDHNSEEARLINNTFAEDYGGDLDELGSEGFIEATFEGDGYDDGDFRLRTGYTRLMEKLVDGLDVRLNTPIKHIRYAKEGVRITTKSGEEFEVDRVIVTLPLGVLKAGDVTFAPVLPGDKLHAIATIGAGKVNKIILTFAEPFWKKGVSAIYTVLDSQMWWRPGWGRDDEQPILTAFAGGKTGAKHSAMSEDEVIKNSLEDLSNVFGKDVTRLFMKGQFINWGADPFSKMGYSFNAVDSAGLREVLAQPIDDTVFFAGEACNTIRPQTVHGAMETGIREAKRILFHAK